MALPQHPARVQVTAKGGAVSWLASHPEQGIGGSSRWNLTEDLDEAGVWPWQEAIGWEREVRQPWRQQYARAVRVADARVEEGQAAQVRAMLCDVPDWDQVVRVTAVPGGVFFEYSDGRKPVRLASICEVAAPAWPRQ